MLCLSRIVFDLVCHSLGGLVARWYLRFGDEIGSGSAPPVTWKGAERVGKCVLVATPNLGSTQAHSDMVHGMNLGIFAADYEAGILGTLPSSYQLLPHGPETLYAAHQGDSAVTGAAPQPSDIFDAEMDIF